MKHPFLTFSLLVVLCVVPAHSAGARPPAAAAAPLQQVPLPYVMRDSIGNNWDVQQDGRIGDGGNNIYDGGGKLFIGNDNNQWTSPQPQAGYDPAHNEVILAPAQMDGLNVTRRVSVNVQKNSCRWVEILDNPGAAPIRTQVHVNFTTGGQISNSRDLVDEKKTHKNVGVAVFDGNHSLAMIAAGRGAKAIPRITYQQNNNQIDFVWEIEVPARQKVALVHLQIARANFNEAAAFWDSAKERDLVADIPTDISRAVLNFPHADKLVNDLEVLRGGLLDVVELRGGDQWRGTLKDTSYRIDTFCGPMELPADQVVSMMTIGTYRPMQLFVTADGEVFGGILQSDSVKLQLTSGQVTSIPLHTVWRLGYRKRSGEPDEWRFDRPTVFLRDGQRMGVLMPTGAIPVSTVYGPLLLKPDSISALVFQSEDQPVHMVQLADGSRFAGLVGMESFDLKIRNSAVGDRTASAPLAGRAPILASATPRTIAFPTASLARLQLSPGADEPDERTPTLSATNGDLLVGALAGSLELETGFDTIRINGAEVRALSHAQEDSAGANGGGAGASPVEVQITLWDDATLSGRLKGDAVPFTLKSGIVVKVPVALIDQYTQPEPRPSQAVLDRIKTIVTDLADPDWRKRDRAAEQLRSLGPAVTSVLKDLKPAQSPEGQKQIDSILKGFDDDRKAREMQNSHPQPPADVVAPAAPAVEVAPNPPPAPPDR